MSRLLLLVLVAAVVLAVLALVVGVFSSAKDGAPAQTRTNGVQKVAYGVLIALMFGVAAGALGDG